MLVGIPRRRRRSLAMKDFCILLPTPRSASSRPSFTSCVTWVLTAFFFGLFIGFSFSLISYKLPRDASYPAEYDDGDVEFGIKGGSSKDLKNITSSPRLNSSSSSLVSKLFHDSSSSSYPFEDGRQRSSEEESNGKLIENHVIFGKSVEDRMPKGFSDEDLGAWRTFVQKEKVVRLQQGCGRMQNRLLIFSDGSKSCCRYRQNFDQIQGEIFSFYLSRLLGLRNVPPSVLNVVKSTSEKWSNVGSQLALAQWNEQRPVVITKFIDKIEPAFIPQSLRPSSRKLHPSNVETVASNNSTIDDELVILAQWSDLIIFDYLTANLDRMVNNLYNLQWNSAMMDAPAHNLVRVPDSNLLVFLDNESGLFHGYRLLDKYKLFHESLLDSLCVFRRSTVEKIQLFVNKGDIGREISRMFRTFDPELQDYLPSIPEKTIKILNRRLKRVSKQIKKCQNLYINS